MCIKPRNIYAWEFYCNCDAHWRRRSCEHELWNTLESKPARNRPQYVTGVCDSMVRDCSTSTSLICEDKSTKAHVLQLQGTICQTNNETITCSVASTCWTVSIKTTCFPLFHCGTIQRILQISSDTNFEWNLRSSKTSTLQYSYSKFVVCLRYLFSFDSNKPKICMDYYRLTWPEISQHRKDIINVELTCFMLQKTCSWKEKETACAFTALARQGITCLRNDTGVYVFESQVRDGHFCFICTWTTWQVILNDGVAGSEKYCSPGDTR